MGRAREQGVTGYDEKRVAEKTSIISLNGSLPLSDLRDEQQTSGSGAIADENAEYKLTHSSAGDFVRLASASRGRYQPGSVGEAGIGIRFGSSPPTSGDYTARWGYFDMELSGGSNTENVLNGLFFGVDKDGQFIEIIREGTQEAKVRESDWNKRSPNLDLTQGHIFEVDYSFYGYGLIRFKYIKDSSTAMVSEPELLHTTTLSQKTSLTNTNLQVGAIIKSSSGTGSFDVFIGGRQYNIVGKYRPRTRITSEVSTDISVGTSGWTPLMAFQKKSGFRQVPVDLDGFSILTDTDLVVRTIQDGGLTNASFGSLTDVPATETAVEVDTSTTAISNGRKTLARLISGGNVGNDTGEAFSQGEIPTDLTDEGTVALEAKAINNTATVDVIGRIVEQW